MSIFFITASKFVINHKKYYLKTRNNPKPIRKVPPVIIGRRVRGGSCGSEGEHPDAEHASSTERTWRADSAVGTQARFTFTSAIAALSG
jgi:hypothetical protein